MTGVSRRSVLGLGVVAAGTWLAGCGRPGALDRLDIACGEPGGTYIQFGRLLGRAAVADGITDSSRALVTAGSVDNLARLKEGSVQLAMCLADSAKASSWAPVAIGRVYQNYLQCLVLESSSITDVDQLRGRRVSIGASASGTAAMTRRVFGAMGLLDAGEKPIEVVEMVLADAISQLQDGRLDGLVFSSGIPIPALADPGLTQRIRLLDLSTALDRIAADERSIYVRTTIPAATYGKTRDVTTIGVANLLLARPDLPDDTAARLIDIILERARDLVPPPSTGTMYLTQQTLIDTMPIVLHPGAVRRYRELHG